MRALIVAAALLAFGGATAQAETLKISQAQWAGYQEYLRALGSTKGGGFAVAANGAFGWAVCEQSGICYDQAKAALQQCQKYSDGEACTVFAIRDDVRVEYEVAE